MTRNNRKKLNGKTARRKENIKNHQCTGNLYTVTDVKTMETIVKKE